MTRNEFIENCKYLSEEQLVETVKVLRSRTGGRVPPEVVETLKSLDDSTTVDEISVTTTWGTSRIYAISAKEAAVGLRPIIVNVHGGGWCLEHSDRDYYFCKRMAVMTGALVIDCDYVLAPEFPYPEAIEELEALIDKLEEIILPLKGDPDRIVLCGQSAGGNLLGAVSQRKKLGNNKNILCQILAYLPADNYNDHFNGEELDDRGVSTEYYGFFYNRNFEERKNSDVSLVMASKEEIENIPETHIITAGLDNLCDEGLKYYNLINETGIKCSYRCFEQSRHGFLVNLYDEWLEGEKYVVELILDAFNH